MTQRVRSIWVNRIAFTALVAIGTVEASNSQSLPIYLASRGSGFVVYGSNKGSTRVVIAKPISAATPIVLPDENGEDVRAFRQELRVLNPLPGTAAAINIVTGDWAYADAILPLDLKFVVVYFEPRNGRARLNNNKVVLLQPGDVASDVAVVTSADRLAPGTTFEERLYASLVEAISGNDLKTMLELCERLPPPPGMMFGLTGSDSAQVLANRKMNEFLTRLSDDVIGRGGVFNLVFHARLVSWDIKGSSVRFVESLLATLNDARAEEVLAFRHVSAAARDLYGSPFDPQRGEEGQSRLLQGAQAARSDRAAAVLATLIARPLKEETKQQYVSLLLRESLRLRVAVCNELARLNDKLDRLLPDERDGDGWEERVEAMARLWLREYGLGG